MMDKKNVILVATVIGVAMLSWLQTGPDANKVIAQHDGHAKNELSARLAHHGIADKHNHHTHSHQSVPMTNGQPSPFASGESAIGGIDLAMPHAAPATTPEKEVISAKEAALRKKMEALGYMVPPSYYAKNLTTLREMGRQGDAFALVHLGEKYYFELNGQKNNPEFDPAMDYPAAAKKSFSEALAVGNIRSAGIISELYLQENNPVDAYAWHLLSKRLGDNISAEWFEKTNVHASLNEQQKQLALAKIPELMSNINNLSAKYKTRPLF